MTTYAVGASLTCISPGDSIQVWSAEQPTAGAGLVSASKAVALQQRSGHPAGFSVNGFFSADPGAFEIDVQVSEVESDSQYQTCANGNLISVDPTNFTFHFDAATVGAKFVRLLMRTRTNAVNVTADFIKQ